MSYSKMIRYNKLINNIADDLKGREDDEHVDLMNPERNNQVTINASRKNSKNACKIW